MADLIGDERGEIAVRFTVESLFMLIEVLNRANIKTVDGLYVERFSVDEYKPGQATILSSMTSVEAAHVG